MRCGTKGEILKGESFDKKKQEEAFNSNIYIL